MSRWLGPAIGSLLLLSACSFGAAAPATGSQDALLDRELVDVVTGESFTLRELAAERPVLLETMAVWCITCLRQQAEVVRAHEMADFHSVGIDVEPNERPEDLGRYAEREGFAWRFVKADAQLVRTIREAFGVAATNPPSTPTFIISTDGSIRALPFGQVRSADDLVTELVGG
jgi:thiol-disulfide isomerase/thioredoxin